MWSSPNSTPRKITRKQTLVEAGVDSVDFKLIDLLRSARNKENDFCDVTITHGEQVFAIHKCLFGTMSEYFHDMLSKDSIGDASVKLNDYNEFRKVKEFVQSVYNEKSISHSEFDFTEMYGKDDAGVLNKQLTEASIRDRLNRDRLGSRRYCDVTIATGTRDFPVHKPIIALQAPYFAKLFTTEMKEKYESTIHVMGIEDDVMALVLDFIYTKEMWVKDDQFINLLTATDYFCMHALHGIIISMLCDVVDVVSNDNCVEMWCAGKNYNAEALANKAQQYISSFLPSILSSEKFLNIDQLHIIDFMHFIKVQLQVSSDDFIRTAISWINYGGEERMEMFGAFYSCVEPESLTKSTWQWLLNEEKLLSSNLAAANAVIAYTRRYVPKADEELGIVYLLHDESKSIYRCDMSSMKENTSDKIMFSIHNWSKCQVNPPVPPDGIANFSLGYANGHVYHIGGYIGKEIETTDKVWSYHMDGGWKEKKSMLEKRQNAAVACVDNVIYVAGGIGFNRKRLCSMEKYENNQWIMLASMSNKRKEFVLVSYQGLLFAIGGVGKNECWVAPIEVYSITGKYWTTISETCPLLLDIKMTVVRDAKVYIVNENEPNTMQVSTFDLAAKEWDLEKTKTTRLIQRCSSFLFTFAGFSVCVLGQEFTEKKKRQNI